MTRPDRLRLIGGSLALFTVALIGRAAYVQLWQGRTWTARAVRQQYADAELPAPRGRILDATGFVLAESRELVRLRIAPREVVDRATLRRALLNAKVDASWVTRATDTARAWVELPGTFLPGDIASLIGTAGVHPRPVAERVYLPSEGVRRIVGRATPDGGAVDGIELALDSVLRGARGTAAVPRDGKGHRLAAAGDADRARRAGRTVVLTINHALQDIAERALADAVRRLGATGGDIVVLDPNSGEVLAMASRRQEITSTAATALTEPYEPGSTLKPFVAARLLALHRAHADEVISTAGGKYTVQGRTINDVHRSERLSLRDVIKWSSNVGIARFAERLSNAEEYELLRDAGFGTPTGIAYPIESSGRLYSPHLWSKQSPASLAIGYELMVTPLQLATAYAAFANGGELLAPALVKEIRDPDGTVRFRHQRRVVRRMMPTQVASQVRGMLMDVVEGGTGTAGELARYDVAGKSGSARRTTNGKYVAGAYTSSFVGLFPADAPQFVILVKLDNSQDGFFGGKVAAPVFRTVLEGAIASRGTSLDLDKLRQSAREPAPSASAAPPAGAQVVARAAAPESLAVATRAAAVTDSGAVAYVVTLGTLRPAIPVGPATRVVPDVHALELRDAVRALHDAGFHVQIDSGPAAAMSPAAGTLLRTGTLIHLVRPR